MKPVAQNLSWFAAMLVLAACEAPWEGPPDWNAIFRKHHVVEWKINTSSEDWLKLIADPRSWQCREGELGPTCQIDLDCPETCRCDLYLDGGTCVTEYVEADVEVDGVLYERVGLRLMGTKRRAKRNMRIRFNKFNVDQRFHGVKRINIRNNAGDPTLIREALALQLMRRAGVPAPRYSFVWVTVNGDSGGVYTLVQQVDKKFLEEQFGEDYGNLYHVEIGGKLVYYGDAEADYAGQPDEYADDLTFARRYELKTNELARDVSDLIGLMRVLDQADAGELYRRVPEVLDVETLLRALAVNSWMANMDSYPGTADNLYLYRDVAERFQYIPWDLNQSFGNYSSKDPCDEFSVDDLIGLDPFAPTCDPERRPLVVRVLSVPEFREQYGELLGELLDGALHPDGVLAEMESMRGCIREKAYEDVLKEYLNTEFDAAFEQDVPEGDNPVRVPGLEPFVRARDEAIRRILSGE
jgi:spore coat protein CotH